MTTFWQRLFPRYTAETSNREPGPGFVGPSMSLDSFEIDPPKLTFPAAYDTYIHREDGRACILEEDGSWFVPLDAGGEGFVCARRHYAEIKTVPGKLTRKMYKDVKWEDEYGSCFSRVEATPETAQVVSSELQYGKGVHAPALDIDVPAFLVPSSTPGHSHLYIDAPCSWRQYKRLLKAMERCGILEPGYVKASINRKGSHVRVPWLKKVMR